MPVTVETKKRLWARSGNQCAICHGELVRADEGKDPGALVGQEAHIIARSPGGARYEPLDPTARDDYSNLILVCANDHREIDTQPGRYPVEKLRRIKRDHEQWVSDQLKSPRQNARSAPIRIQAIQSADQLWNLMADAMAYDCNGPERLALQDADLVDECLQNFVDWGELATEVSIQGFRAVREGKRSLQESLDSLAAAGFTVFGGAGRAQFGIQDPVTLPVAIIRVLREQDLSKQA